jgi:hypothetical protein
MLCEWATSAYTPPEQRVGRWLHIFSSTTTVVHYRVQNWGTADGTVELKSWSTEQGTVNSRISS